MLSVGVWPFLAAVIRRCSAMATVLVGSLVFCLLTPRRWEAAGTLALGAIGAVGAVLVLEPFGDLVNGPLDSALAEEREPGGSVARAAGGALWRHVRPPGASSPGLPRPSRRLGHAAAGVAGVVALVALVAADPVERFNNFSGLPPAKPRISRTSSARTSSA